MRIDYRKLAPDAIKTIIALDDIVYTGGLEKSLILLIRLRASQINGCSYCVDVHTREAINENESERRLHALVVWHDSPFFTERERAALAWTEAVTLLSETQVPDETFQRISRYFNEKEIVDLTMAIVAINSWNRLAVSFRRIPKV